MIIIILINNNETFSSWQFDWWTIFASLHCAKKTCSEGQSPFFVLTLLFSSSQWLFSLLNASNVAGLISSKINLLHQCWSHCQLKIDLSPPTPTLGCTLSPECLPEKNFPCTQASLIWKTGTAMTRNSKQWNYYVVFSETSTFPMQKWKTS